MPKQDATHAAPAKERRPDAAPRRPPASCIGTGTGTAVYWTVALAGTFLFYGAFLFSDRVGILDWSKDLFYFHFLYDSLRSFGRLPLAFLAIPADTTWFSTLQDLSYWSNPEVISLSPFLPLAWVLPFTAFMKAYFGLHILLAIVGVRLLARRAGLATGQAVALLVLFLFNPWLVQHLAIGYSPQISLCLVPLLAGLLAGKRFRPLAWAGASLLAAWIFYQGALHLFVWLCMAVGLCIAFYALLSRRAGTLWRAAFFFAGTLILVSPKAYAVSKVYGGWTRIPAGGYGSLADIWGLLTDAVFPMFRFPETYSKYNVAFYDGSLLVGAAFVVLVGWLAAEYLARPRKDDPRRLRDGACLLCACVFLALGWGTVWRTVSLWLHLSSAEIYPFRFLFIAYNFLIFFVADRLGRFPTKAAARLRALTLYALLACTCLTFYGRNRELMPYLTENPNFYGAFSIADFYKDRIVALAGDTRLPVTATPGSVTLIPSGIPGQHVRLPWMAWKERGHYRFEGARPFCEAPGGGTVLEVTAASRPVVILPDDSHRFPLLVLAALAFAALTAGTISLNRRRPGLFTAETPKEARHA
ncbi:conserved hypothetical protein [Solidesulfovibrio fructosivorans JJ]]|uniref:Membrane protein 6-pyruvoyl-tetrahydropterin synthase-related domain-containing protein n=1 Tax=Solidesulfovibrio fructosivorans JJ] TaxID=596151 RepID=E1JZL5_SOLFR|nr:hypothetical protein [Solidesulfovibrio fructosivorans]EFL50150.1 conserved hypothetical protein [Solidesulfovibrio fructosivorans JJ]]